MTEGIFTNGGLITRHPDGYLYVNTDKDTQLTSKPLTLTKEEYVVKFESGVGVPKQVSEACRIGKEIFLIEKLRKSIWLYTVLLVKEDGLVCCVNRCHDPKVVQLERIPLEGDLKKPIMEVVGEINMTISPDSVGTGEAMIPLFEKNTSSTCILAEGAAIPKQFEKAYRIRRGVPVLKSQIPPELPWHTDRFYFIEGFDSSKEDEVFLQEVWAGNEILDLKDIYTKDIQEAYMACFAIAVFYQRYLHQLVKGGKYEILYETLSNRIKRLREINSFEVDVNLATHGLE